MGNTQEGLRACLLADLRTLAFEAKRPESLAGQLTGWISGPEHPGIRDAADRVVQQLSEDTWPAVLADFEVPNLSTVHEMSVQHLRAGQSVEEGKV